MKDLESHKVDPLHGLDSRWSWITAASCTWMLFFATFSVRVTGVLFFGIMGTFGVTRKQASWPVTLHSCFLHLGGPVMGLLCRRFSCRTVLLVCTSLTGPATALCFFAEGVLFINIFFGVLHGFTLSGMLVGVNVVMAQHFEKWRNTAFSVLFSVSSLSTFAIPPAIEFFRITYGIRGAFLLLGALMFNTLPGAIIVKSPAWMNRNFNQGVKKKEKKSNRSILSEKLQSKRKDETVCSEASFPGTISAASRIDATKDVLDWSTKVNNSQTPTEGTVQADELKETMKKFLSVLFWCDALSFATVVFSQTTFVLLSVDLSRDKNITPSEAVYLLYALSAGDTVFRTVSGLVIDSGHLSLEAVMALGHLVQALAFELLVWSTSLPMLLLSSVLVGVGHGSTIFLETPVCVKDFGMSALPIMVGGMSFCVGVVILGLPILTGHFRDKLQDYNGLLHVIAVANVLLLAIWSLRMVVERRKRRKSVSLCHRKKNQQICSINVNPVSGTCEAGNPSHANKENCTM
ncbi:monocarboxylate transporter 2 [Ixodes scapularis]|uniref:monocarboxylate transporter 2 n=1 Tax=Ixodes scapularis TaxID=6945 RepID=UPI001C38CAF2|nr:monocarboxylate transporter 2 [Ixodes scapularis]XP_042146956.1 monocarboxylate transporter 2 [Ixodes scapularis]XP_042146957.1 monocarboxylate transporter 2 [Ixodes scapularis]